MGRKFNTIAVTMIFSTLVILPGLSERASAKSARCYTSDDGHYNCRFISTDKNGSFEISAKGKPTFNLNIDRPGIAYGFANYGTGRSVALPGYYIRRQDDPACWTNNETNTSICAW